MSANQRRQPRSLAEVAAVVREPGGKLIDDRAQAHDLSVSGFRLETRARIERGEAVQFELVLAEDQIARGRAEIVWVREDQWGWYNCGVKITKLSWADAGRLKRFIYEPGYDFVLLARRALWAVFWIVLAAGLHNFAFHQPEARRLARQLAPVAGACVILGWSLLTLLRRRE